MKNDIWISRNTSKLIQRTRHLWAVPVFKIPQWQIKLNVKLFQYVSETCFFISSPLFLSLTLSGFYANFFYLRGIESDSLLSSTKKVDVIVQNSHMDNFGLKQVCYLHAWTNLFICWIQEPNGVEMYVLNIAIACLMRKGEREKRNPSEHPAWPYNFLSIFSFSYFSSFFASYVCSKKSPPDNHLKTWKFPCLSCFFKTPLWDL